ncbi:MAG: A/G-specific adenine glycosylase [Phycisphaerales bacterium]|nr:A/G-specific adenine glycosylase [Phycisphaerales bacterium]
MAIRTRPARGSNPPPDAGWPSIQDPASLARALEEWFPGEARSLPWRRERSGYRALVSELMLQQTQVSRVIGAFERFVERFPTAAALAGAPEDEVLAAWQGLGYYRRARLLHAAARAVVERHGGDVPRTEHELRALPGIGRYTAGAIASIAFGERVAIVDGNVLRVLSRVAGAPARVADAASERWAWEQSARLVAQSSSPAVLNEALMELGATVCTPAAPRCGGCPAEGGCAARRAGTQAAIPAPRIAAPRRTERWTSLVWIDGNAVALERRPDRGMWAGMHQPPTVPTPGGGDGPAWPCAVREVGAFTHVTTHRTIEFTVVVPDGAARIPADAGWTRAPLGGLDAYALSNAAWRTLEVAGLDVTRPPAAAAGRRAPRRAATGS